jgi:hypothetical protein
MDSNTAYLIVSLVALILSEIAPFVNKPVANGLVHAIVLALGTIAKTQTINPDAQAIASAAFDVCPPPIKEPVVASPTESCPLILSPNVRH